MSTSTTSQTKTLVLWLIDTAPSGFIREGTEDHKVPDELKYPGDYSLPVESYINEKGLQKKIRYIYGTNLIFVDQQDKAGIKPNALNDVIWFKNGKLVVADTPEDKGLFDYLSKCSWNRDNPDRAERVKAIFYVEDKAGEAKKNLLLRTAKNKALDLVQTLVEIGPKGTTFAESKIDFLCTLFNISLAMSFDEKVNLLMDKAEQDPEDFIGSVADTTNQYRASINEALQLEVLSIDGGKASLVKGKGVFLTLAAKDENGKVDELIQFFLTTGGEFYKQMGSDVNTKKSQMALNA